MTPTRLRVCRENIISGTGVLTIVQKELFRSTTLPGWGRLWTEYQVKRGGRVLSRHDTYKQAENAIPGHVAQIASEGTKP